VQSEGRYGPAASCGSALPVTFPDSEPVRAYRRAVHMYLPPVTMAYTQKAPMMSTTPAMIEMSTQRIIRWPLAVMLRPFAGGPQPDAGVSCAQCGISTPKRNGGAVREWDAMGLRWTSLDGCSSTSAC
jgi:hypothetical protein